jgi:hypothetical protein
MSDWIQTHWFELGSLLIQCAILATLARYGRKTLGIIRALQTHDEAVEGLSPAPAAAEPAIRQTFTPATPAAAPEYTEDGASGIAAVWGNLTSWLQEPMVSPEAAPGGRIARWLQAPM